MWMAVLRRGQGAVQGALSVASQYPSQRDPLTAHPTPAQPYGPHMSNFAPPVMLLVAVLFNISEPVPSSLPMAGTKQTTEC